MSGQRRGKTLIITDDEEEEEVQEEQADDLNPFSFREFMRWKTHDPDEEQDQNRVERGLPHLDADISSCFLSETHLAAQEEEDWRRSFQSGLESTSSLCTEDDEEEEEETRFSSKPEGSTENYEGDDETSLAEAAPSCRRRTAQMQQLKEENQALRRTLRELQRRAEADQRRVTQLTEELLQRRRQEEKEAQDLENMVHSVEQNLQLMTKRAVKAENTVSRLKAELQQLQGEVHRLGSENSTLKAAESQVVMTMRQNAQVASEYLNKTTSHAYSSIRQLMGEAETLRLVSQLLQSIDKISGVDAES